MGVLPDEAFGNFLLADVFWIGAPKEHETHVNLLKCVDFSWLKN